MTLCFVFLFMFVLFCILACINDINYHSRAEDSVLHVLKLKTLKLNPK